MASQQADQYEMASVVIGHHVNSLSEIDEAACWHFNLEFSPLFSMAGIWREAVLEEEQATCSFN